jgi:GAF domain
MQNIPDKLQSVLISLSEQAAHLLKTEAVSIWILEGDRLYLAADTGGNLQKGTGSIYYTLGEGLTGSVAAQGKPIRLKQDALQSHSAWRGKFDAAMWPAESTTRIPVSFMAVPIIVQDKTLGILRASSAQQEFTEAEQRLLETIASLIATALKSEPAFLDTESGPYLFVLMPFSEEFFDIYKLGIKSVATKLGMRCERVDEIEFNDAILAQIYDGIQRADLVIADMTGKNPNVFYEVGYAHALPKEVILLAQMAQDIPFDLAGHNHIVYKGSITTLQERLEKRLLAFLAGLRKGNKSNIKTEPTDSADKE